MYSVHMSGDYIQTKNILPEGYGDDLLLLNDIDLFDKPMDKMGVGVGEALLIYWPEAFDQREFETLCNNNRFNKIIGCNGDSRNIIKYKGPGNIIKTEKGVYSYDLPNYFEKHLDKSNLDNIKVCFLYERDLAMAPFYNDIYSNLNLNNANLESEISIYQDKLMDFLSDNVFKISEKLSDLFDTHGIKLVVIEDLHDFVYFYKAQETINFGYPTINVGLIGLSEGSIKSDQDNLIDESKILLDRLFNTAKKTYDSPLITGVTTSNLFVNLRPHMIMSKHLDVKDLF
ncbi:MAG: hypothetical protein K0B02_02930 [DPANN group archaeon]|nr:hypothetical protein [DPANN group archaeon]